MKIKQFIPFVCLFLFPYFNFAKVNLPAIFSDNMVIQRNAEVTIWGWAKPGEEIKVTVSWNDLEVKTKPDNSGHWKLKIKTADYIGEQWVKIKGYNEVVFKNVLLGEVFLIAGQSNMEWSAEAGIEGGEQAIRESNNSNIRFFTVNHRTASNPQNDLSGTWVESSPETMKKFSAAGYFFAQKLQKDLNVPVGVVNSSWGGTPAEPWIPAKTIINDSTLTMAAELLPETEWGPSKPGLIYNAMIYPLINFKFSGILWYQGESNTPNADYYEETFSALIRSWRGEFKEELPFYFAQIAPFNYETQFTGVKIRDAQRRTLNLPKTGMVMTSDIGNINDIHPKNKKEVGIRFANLVLMEQFGSNIKAKAPLIQKAIIKNGKIILTFLNSEGLYLDKNNRTGQFEVAGPDKIFEPAKFYIEDNRVILSRGNLKNPGYIRYSWGNTSISNIFNMAKLPASSFYIKIK